MHKHRKAFIFFAAMLTLSGCGGNVAIKKQDLDALKGPIQVLHRPTPALDMPSTAGVILTMVGGAAGHAVTAGAGPALAGAVASVSTTATGTALNKHSSEAMNQRINTDCVIPDAGYAVTGRFMKEWKREGGAPDMVLIAQPLADDQKISGPTITFTPTAYVRSINGYLVLYSRLEMSDGDGKVLFREEVGPKDFGDYFRKAQKHSKEEFLADNCRLLKLEVNNLSQFVAEQYEKVIRSQLQGRKHQGDLVH